MRAAAHGVAGYKRDLGRIMEVQALARDIGSARAILDALPMPVAEGPQQPPHLDEQGLRRGGGGGERGG